MIINRAIFVESTISQDEIQPFLNATDVILPSIKRGQLIELHSNFPFLEEVIIVDGVFEQSPSITHKEILWLLSKKVNIVGIASMGAMRAYELRNHGVKGHGWVYEQYLNGHIDGDDEVAVSYDPTDPSNTKTLAMVNFRKSLLNKQNSHWIDLIKSIHFKERTWQVLSKHISDSLLKEMREVYVDVKKEDLLAYIKYKPDLFDNSQLDFTSNAYFNRMRISHSGRSLTECLKKKINNLRIQEHNHDYKIQNNCLYICNFLLLPHSCAAKIASLLSSVDGVNCNSKKIKNICIMVKDEFKIRCQYDLYDLLKSRNIPIMHAYHLFHDLTKLIDILI